MSQGPDSCVHQIHEEGIIQMQGDCTGQREKLENMPEFEEADGVLQIDATVLAKAAKRVQTNLDRPLGAPPMWIFAGLYVIAAPVAFFGTVFVAHEPMRKGKYALAQNLSNRFNEEYNVVHGRLGAQAIVGEERFNNLRRINELRGITEAFPVWSLDPGSISKFLAANAPAIVIAGVGIVKRVLS